MLFLLLFGLLLAKILTEQEPEIRWYVLLGIAGYLCFLTRYYGIFVWMVTGLYLLLLLINYRKQRDRKLLFKAAGLGAAAFVSGCFFPCLSSHEQACKRNGLRCQQKSLVGRLRETDQ